VEAELEVMWMGQAVANLKATFHHLPGGTDENTKISVRTAHLMVENLTQNLPYTTHNCK
jgi:hypothetical protein